MRNERVMIKLVTACAAPAVAALLVACSQTGHQPSTPSAQAASTSSLQPAPPAATFATAVPAGVDSACENATPSAQQLTGDWTDSGAIVTTLGVDGALKSSGGNRSGTWTYAPWVSTPGKSSMPAGEENQCVLWLHWQSLSPPMDLVYVPLKATNDSLELSYVGRGNTLHWVRPHASA
jgi:hypothetical protein